MKYGVKRLIAINSGKFELAEFDLAHSVHLSAPNNRGKSTLVNSLQFIYVDKIDRMHFGKRTSEDTQVHYFGQSPSYLVFECATPSGIQTMLVCGLGAIQAGKFERFVYAGGYNRNDYIEADGTIRTTEDLKASLADRELTEIPQSQLWEVLSGQIAYKGRILPRLSILPLRNYEEYRSFREVFVGLLKLKNADARMLRRLIIACHARDIGERRVDVAALYRKMFDQATRSEQEFRLIHSVAGLIDTGVALRAEMREVFTVLGNQFAAIWSQANRCAFTLTQRLAAIVETIAEYGNSKSARDEQRDTALRDEWDATKAFEQAEGQVDKLKEAHLRWGGISVEMIEGMRQEATDVKRKVARLEDNIRRAGTFDHNAMRRNVDELERQIRGNRHLIEDFDRTALAHLMKADMAPAEIERAFHLLHPDALKLIVGEHIEVRSSKDLVDRIRTISDRVQGSNYQDDAVRVRLDSLRGPDLRTMSSHEAVAAQLKLDEERLRESKEGLRVAEELEPAIRELKRQKDDMAKRQAALEDYSNYERDWAGRSQLEAQLASAKTRACQAAEKVRLIKDEISQLEQQLSDLGKEQMQVQQRANSLHHQLGDLRSIAERISLPLAEVVEQPPMGSFPVLEIATELCEQIKDWIERAGEIDKRRGELKRIESQIVKVSADSKAYQVYFDDPDVVWSELAEKREALAEQEHSVQKQWDDLFTLLTANFEQIIVGIRNVETAVRALNRGIQSYQVSNLKAVELSVMKIAAIYNPIETLASKGSIFQDADNIEQAKRVLRNMIEGNQVIELENLFEIRIRVQENDGKWNDARSLDDIGSTGTGITAKAMIFIQLVRAIVRSSDVGLHFYLDETGQLDDENLKATTAMAVSRGMVPITAQPGVRLESLAHPEVTVYTLGATVQGQFHIDNYQTYHARRTGKTSEKARHEPNRDEILKEPA